MTPDDLERELASATAGIDPPSSAWSQIAARGRVRRHRRIAVLGSAAAVVPVALAVATLHPARTPQHSLVPPPASSTTAEPTPPAQTPAAPEPTQLVAVHHGAVELYQREGRLWHRASVISESGQTATWVAFTPAKEGVVYTVTHGCSTVVWTARLDGTQRHPILTTTHAAALAPALSPDGRLIAYGSDTACGAPSSSVDPPEPSVRLQVDDLTTGRGLWTSPDIANSLSGLGWSAARTVTYALGYCCDATVEVHNVQLDAMPRLDQKVNPPTGCDWRFGSASAFETSCDTGAGSYQPRLGFDESSTGPAVYTQDDRYSDIAQLRPAEPSRAMLVVAFSYDHRQSALFSVHLETPSQTQLILTGVSSADW
jgi:hypothetical protein